MTQKDLFLKNKFGYIHTREARFGRGFGPVVRQTTKWMTYQRLYRLLGLWKGQVFILLWIPVTFSQLP